MPAQPIFGDAARRHLGLLSIEETAALADSGVVIPDPTSTLVSPDVAFGEGVVLWPGTILQRCDEGSLELGAGTILYPGTRIVASGGAIRIGRNAEIGEEGGFTVKAEAGHTTTIGDGARLLGGGSLALSNRIGRGAQILGPIRCQACRLGDGDTYRDPDPDERGGVLKGSGVARSIHVPQGWVIQSFDIFADAVMRPQSHFHPKVKVAV
jgi:carbonic anhydrase/acetyltransferase-like protein (isoleucine patch superfamily)